MIKYNNYRNYFALNKYIENLPRIKTKKKYIKKFFENPDSIVILIFYKILNEEFFLTKDNLYKVYIKLIYQNYF